MNMVNFLGDSPASASVCDVKRSHSKPEVNIMYVLQEAQLKRFWLHLEH